MTDLGRTFYIPIPYVDSMGIYATVDRFSVSRFNDGERFEIVIQAVPSHIVHVGPAWEFLPPPVDPQGRLHRAVIFVEEGDPNETARSIHEYPKSLLKCAGLEYHDIRFVDLMHRLDEAMDARHLQQM